MLRPQPLPPIPTETVRIAQAAFPKGHPYLRAADELGAVFADSTFTALFPRRGQPALVLDAVELHPYPNLGRVSVDLQTPSRLRVVAPVGADVILMA